MPRTAARILTEVAGKDFADAGHLASYAGIAPATRRSGTLIRGEHAPRGGNKHMKRALFLSAFASLHHGPSRAYYDRKRAQGKRHNQALIALARRRSDVVYAMLRDGALYQDPTTPQTPSAVALAARRKPKSPPQIEFTDSPAADQRPGENDYYFLSPGCADDAEPDHRAEIHDAVGELVWMQPAAGEGDDNLFDVRAHLPGDRPGR